MNVTALLGNAPNTLVLFAVGGLLLIYLELNRPGSILPGAVGLTILLWCTAALLALPWRPVALVLFAGSAAVQLFSIRNRLLWVAGSAVGCAVYLGCRELLHGPDGKPTIRVFVSVLAGLVLGPGTSMLTGFARHARRNKGLDS